MDNWILELIADHLYERRWSAFLFFGLNCQAEDSVSGTAESEEILPTTLGERYWKEVAENRKKYFRLHSWKKIALICARNQEKPFWIALLRRNIVTISAWNRKNPSASHFAKRDYRVFCRESEEILPVFFWKTDDITPKRRDKHQLCRNLCKNEGEMAEQSI